MNGFSLCVTFGSGAIPVRVGTIGEAGYSSRAANEELEGMTRPSTCIIHREGPSTYGQ